MLERVWHAAVDEGGYVLDCDAVKRRRGGAKDLFEERSRSVFIMDKQREKVDAG